MIALEESNYILMGAKNNEFFLRLRVTMFLDENCDKIPAKFSDKLKKEGWFF